MIANYRLKFQDKAGLEEVLTSSGAKILDSEVLSIARQRFTRLDTTPTYAKGIKQLQKEADLTGNLDPLHNFTRPDGSPIYRPLTFAGNLLARIEDYETLKNPDGTTRIKEERLRLLDQWLNSCTGITSEVGSTKIKIDPISLQLITIVEDFNKAYLPVEDFNSAPGIPLDTSKGIYNEGLTQAQVPEHPAWLAAVEENKKLLRDHAKIVFTELAEKRKKLKEDILAMGFYPVVSPKQNQLRDLVVDNLEDDSYAGGYLGLNYLASFLRLAQKSAPKATPKK